MMTITAAVLVTLSGCGTFGDDVESKNKDDVKAVVRQQAATVAGMVRSGNLQEKVVGDYPCTGKLGESNDRVYTVQGIFGIPLAADQQVATINRIRETWTAQGWTVTGEITNDPRRGNVTFRTKPDDYSIQLLTAPGLDMLNVSINSPCYESPK
jgi:hypothetical protein